MTAISRKGRVTYTGVLDAYRIDDIEKLLKKNTSQIYDILIISGILVMDIDGDYKIKTKHFNGSFKIASPVQKKKKKLK